MKVIGSPPGRRRIVQGSVAALTSLSGVRGFAGPARKKAYRACIIGHTGAGAYGHDVDLAFRDVPGVQVAAVADPDEAGRQAAARRIGAPRAYSDWKEMLRKEKPDIVANGPRTVSNRLEVFAAAAQIGAHVLSEKPMAASLQDADRIMAVCEKAGIKTAFVLPARVSPSVVHAKKMLEQGLIGDLLEMHTYGKEDARSGGEDLMVLGTHAMVLMRYFLGNPLWCAAEVTQDGKEIRAADRRDATEPLGYVAGDTIHATYSFGKGVHGHFASQKQRGGSGGRFGALVYGTRGVLQLGPEVLWRVRYLADPRWRFGEVGMTWKPLPGAPAAEDVPRGTAGANRLIALDLISAIESGGQSVVSGYECRAALEMIHAVYASHLSGARARFPLHNRRHPLDPI